MNMRYQLQPYKGPQSRHTCPECQHRGKTFTRYIDTQTGDALADHVGRCNRQENCCYHYKPRQYFSDNKVSTIIYRPPKPPVKRPPKPFHTIPRALMDNSLRRYNQNVFCNFLTGMLGRGAAGNLVQKYHIGTARHWPGATIFWQVDVKGNIRTGKIMLYDATNCKRVKQPYNHIVWVHNLLPKPADTATASPNFRTSRQSGYNLQQCFFGEHLLPLQPGKPVAIVESEKTAVIASNYNPQYIWLAAGSLNGLTPQKCTVLAGRTVVFYPDVNAYPRWREKAEELNCRIPTAHFSVDDTLLNNATPLHYAQGSDIADLYIDEMLAERELLKEYGLRGIEGEEF